MVVRKQAAEAVSSAKDGSCRCSPAMAGSSDSTPARALCSPLMTSLCEPRCAASRIAPMQHCSKTNRNAHQSTGATVRAQAVMHTLQHCQKGSPDQGTQGCWRTEHAQGHLLWDL